MLTLRKSREGQTQRSIHIKCTNANCKLSITINPAVIQDVCVLQESCPRCTSMLNYTIPMLSLTFQSAPAGMSNPYKACVCAHDDLLRHYGFVNMAPLDMSTRPFTASEITQILQTRTQPTQVEPGVLPVNQLAWLAPVAAAAKSKQPTAGKPVASTPIPKPLSLQNSPQLQRPPAYRPPTTPITHPPPPVPRTPVQTPSRAVSRPVPRPPSMLSSVPPPVTPSATPSATPSVPPSMAPPANYHPPYPFVSSTPPPNTTVLCNCGEPAALRTTTKPGNNQGRQFYCCSKPRDQQCDFFCWSDDPRAHTPNPTRPIPGSSILRSNPTGPSNKRDVTCYSCGKKGHFASECTSRGKKEFHQTKPESQQPKIAKKRCCGFCHKPGHTRKTCPELKQTGSDFTMDYTTDYGDMDMEDMDGIYWEA